MGRAASSPQWDPIVCVEIAEFLVGLTAVLDYLANEIVVRYDLPLKESSRRRVYFPIGGNWQTRNPDDFRKRMQESFPALESKAPEVYAVLEYCQPYQRNIRRLPLLKKLVNENKHLSLSRLEERGEEYAIEGGSGARQIRKSSFTGPPGALPQNPNAFLRGGGLIFGDTGEPVVPLLTQCRDEVDRIVAELGKVGIP